LNIVNPSYAFNNYQYKCVINAGSCGILTSNAASLAVLPVLVASNSIPLSCGSWNGSVDITISVANVGFLNSTTNTLRQINLSLGSSLCKRDLSTYDFTLISPDGLRSLKFVDNFNTVATPQWISIKYRDHSSLERVSEYSISTQTISFPFSYGYYAVQQDGSLIDAFNGINANGDWILRIEEANTSTINPSNGISFNNVNLFFGPDFIETDVTGNTINNACQAATCMGADNNIIIGTNNTYTSSDGNLPDVITGPPYAADCADSQCDWNGANNNSAWYYFFATSPTARITVSGTSNISPGSSDMQLIVLDANNGCSSGINWVVPTGGCLDDETAACFNEINNTDYYDFNGGGTANGSVYFNGISINSEFKLSNLFVGRKYFLVIDGNGGLSSTYYIEVESGAANCIFGGLLPVKFYSFNVAKYGSKNQLIWKTSEEINNDYFQVERSSDGRNWSVLQSIEGAGRESRTLRSYEVYDAAPLVGANYYRIKQVSSDGSYTYSEVRKILNNGITSISVFPNPATDFAIVDGLDKNRSNMIHLLDVTGKLISEHFIKDSQYRFDLSKLQPGIYHVVVNGSEHFQLVKKQ
jgi:hypothetical protein